MLSKDPLTIITNAWGVLQLTWTFMLIFVHLVQIARNLTTFESMRGIDQVNPLMSAITTGSMTLDGAQITDSGAGPDAAGHGHAHGHKHKQRKQEGCLSRWGKILGIDTFIAIAFQGYKGHKENKQHQHTPKQNPFTRGMLRNCQDFWMDGPIFGRKESNKALLGGQVVDYANMYDIPRGGMQYRGGYESVATAEEEV